MVRKFLDGMRIGWLRSCTLATHGELPRTSTIWVNWGNRPYRERGIRTKIRCLEERVFTQNQPLCRQ